MTADGGRCIIFGHMCDNAAVCILCYEVTMFVVIATLREMVTVIVVDHGIKFAKWQHPAVGRGARLLCLATLHSTTSRE